MRTLILTLAYDGTAYVGWQRQAEGTSVQGLIEAAVARIEGQPVAVHGAGRTDAGVHALGQVASVEVSSAIACDAYARALNASLPLDVRVVDVRDDGPAGGPTGGPAGGPAAFHARFSARGKTYRYRVLQGRVPSPFEARYAWHVTHPLDHDAMRAALDACRGTHDFAAFQATGTRVRDTVRTIAEATLTTIDTAPDAGTHPGALAPAFWMAGQSLLILELTGDGFLRHMVRTIAGTLVEIGRGRWPADEMAGIIASRDRARAGPTAPPHGLFLVRVRY